MIFRSVFFAFAMVLSAQGFSQGYPTRPVRVINPFPAGGPVDLVARPLLERLRQELDQPFVMENRPGAGTVIGSDAVAKSAPDGYTLLVTASQHSINPAIYPKLPYDTVKDFAPIAPIAHGPFVLVVHPSVPANDVKQLIAYAKSVPGKINFGSASSGSGFHMAGEMFKLLAGVNIVHVPYKGGAPVTTAVLAGEVAIVFSSPATVLSHVQAGKLRLLGVTTLNRSALIPDVPAMSESLPGFDVVTWYGMLAPAGTSREIIERISHSVDKIVNGVEFRELMKKVGLEPAGGTPGQFGIRISSEITKWTRIAKESGAKVD